MNIDLGLTTWHNNIMPVKSNMVRHAQESGESFTGNDYLPHGKKRKNKKKLTSIMQPAVICSFSGYDPVFIQKIPLTYDRFGKIRYIYEFIKQDT